MINSNRPCPICKSEHNIKLGTLKYVHFDDSSLPSDVDVVSCKNCGFVFNNITIPQETLNNYSPKYLSNLNKSDNKFINLSHILEHIIDLNDIIQNISIDDINKELYVEVPNSSVYGLSSTPLRFFYFSHINHFDMIHLRNLFINKCYKPVKYGHIVYKEGELHIPSVWMVFRKDNKNKIPIVKDFDTSNRIRRWINTEIDNNCILKNISYSKEKIYLWGIGLHTNLILGMSPLKDCINRITFVDNDINKQKRTIANKTIHSPEILKNLTDKDTVIICAPSHYEEIYNNIQKYKTNCKIISIGFNKICKIQ